MNRQPLVPAPYPLRRRDHRAAVALGAAATALLVLTLAVLLNQTGRVDASMLRWLLEHRTPRWVDLAHVGSSFAGGSVVVAVGVLLIGVLLVLRDRVGAALMAGLLLAAGALTYGGKHLIGRARPPAAVQVLPLETGFAFPSGHTLFAVALWGGAAVLLGSHLRSRALRTIVGLGAGGIALAVAASRWVLGYHWVSDVAASLLAGACLLALVVIGRRAA